MRCSIFRFFLGDTGPLVYPAGFVYIYSILYFVTSYGSNIRLGQYIFIGIYLAQLFLVLRLYAKSHKVPPIVLVLTTFTSYRIHSIYVLRLFNDPVAVLFLYLAINLFIEQKWSLGSIFFSIAVSVKMNILLFAPALLLFFITNLGYLKTFKQLIICATIQLVLGAPFLLTYPIEYLKGSFDLVRVFEHKWTVNYRFLDRELFENSLFHLLLLIIHLILLGLFFKPSFKFFQNYARIRVLQEQLQPQIDAKNKDNATKKSKHKKDDDENEELTAEQEIFLKSFEKSIKQSSGNVEKSGNSKKSSEKDLAPEIYSINFDKSTQLALLPLFISNFIGIMCARSLHYQFYVWYFHSLPYLTWYTDYSTSLKFLILAVIELSWNTYPSTIFSSSLLHITHLVLFYGISKKYLKT